MKVIRIELSTGKQTTNNVSLNSRLTNWARLSRIFPVLVLKISQTSVLGKLRQPVTLPSKQTIMDFVYICFSNRNVKVLLIELQSIYVQCIDSRQFYRPKIPFLGQTKISHQTKMDNEGTKPILMYK